MQEDSFSLLHISNPKTDITMVPILISQIGLWLDRFGKALDQWEHVLQLVEQAYLRSDCDGIVKHCEEGDSIHAELSNCKKVRLDLLDTARQMGLEARHLQDLSIQLDGHWPALWTHRIRQLELQLNRIQRLSTSLWISAFQSNSIVSDMLLILATGRVDSATYSPAESRSIEGGYVINEAA